MNRSIRPITLALIFALTVSSCASQYGSGWLSDAEQATHDGYGAWVRVTTVLSETLHDLDEGELLAFSKDSLYLLIPGKRSINAFARHDIDEVVGNTYERGGYAVFAVEALVGSIVSIFTVGALSGIIWLGYIISAIIGSIVASNISRISYYSGVSNWDDADWHQLSTYARFPTGLPPTYNRSNPKTKLWRLDR